MGILLLCSTIQLLKNKSDARVSAVLSLNLSGKLFLQEPTTGIFCGTFALRWQNWDLPSSRRL